MRIGETVESPLLRKHESKHLLNLKTPASLLAGLTAGSWTVSPFCGLDGSGL